MRGKNLDLTVLMSLLAVVGGVWLFVEIADEVRDEGKTQAFDEWVIRSLRRSNDLSKPIGPDWLAEMGRDATALGGVLVVTLATAAVLGYLLLAGKGRTALFLAMAVVAGALLTGALKHLMQRERPSIVPHLSIVATTSFPSGHSMLSAVVYGTLGALLARTTTVISVRLYFLLVAVLLTGVVGASRVYMGVHYPTDVLAGWTAGITWALLCWMIDRALQRKGQVEPPTTG